MKIKVKNLLGFTLIEMLLVLTIISAIIYAGISYVQQRTLQTQIDKTSAQMQQILNAGLAYYVNNGAWPANISCLYGAGGTTTPSCDIQYLPPNLINNAWGYPYATATNSTMFYVYAGVPGASAVSASTIATVIAGTLPLGYTTGDTSNKPPAYGTACGVTIGSAPKLGPAPAPSSSSSGTLPTTSVCNVVASVNIPGQNLNNARAVNFAGLYSHGGCVPAPSCPVDLNGNQMTPQIMLVPVSVSGVNDPNSTNSYPLVSFTGYATGDSPLDNTPPGCQAGGVPSSNTYNPGKTGTCSPTPGPYWRACLQVVTEKGNVQTTNTSAWGKDVTLMAITRCAVVNEPSGTGFNLYSN